MAKTMPAQRPGRSTQEVRTPRVLLRAVRALLGIDAFTVDLAATRENTVARNFYSKQANALRHPWHLGGWNWLNPEFGTIAPWVRKAHEEQALGAKTIVLVPAAVGANWWRDWVHGKAQVLLLNGRITFVGHAQPYPKDCALLVYAADWAPGYRIWSWMAPNVSDAERALRDLHVSRQIGEQAPSRHLLAIDEVNLRLLAQEIVTPTVQMQAREYVDLLDAGTLGTTREQQTA